MITAILATIVIWCLFYTILPKVVLIILSIILGGFLVIISRHKHDGHITIDVIAQKSRLNQVNSSLKFWTVLLLLFLCVASDSSIVGLVLAVLMLIFTVFIGGLELHDYLSYLSIPVSFLLISTLALLFDYNIQPAGVINLPLLQGYLSVGKAAQEQAALVMTKALGAISCLYLLSLTTTMSEIIGVLRRSHIPDIIVELMYLIYRFTFILLELYHSMNDAAKSRMGFVDFTTGLRTTGNIYSNLLARSYRQANRYFDAMESRCYDGEIRFLEYKKNILPLHLFAAVSLIIFTLGLNIVLR